MRTQYCTCDTVLLAVSVKKDYSREEQKKKAYFTGVRRNVRLREVYYCPKCDMFVRTENK